MEKSEWLRDIKFHHFQADELHLAPIINKRCYFLKAFWKQSSNHKGKHAKRPVELTAPSYLLLLSLCIRNNCHYCLLPGYLPTPGWITEAMFLTNVLHVSTGGYILKCYLYFFFFFFLFFPLVDTYKFRNQKNTSIYIVTSVGETRRSSLIYITLLGLNLPSSLWIWWNVIFTSSREFLKHHWQQHIL